MMVTLPMSGHSAPLSLDQVAPGVWVHRGLQEEFAAANRGDIANLTLIVGSEAAAVVDTGGSPGVGADFLAAVKNVTALPVRWVINTHAHPDHIFGNGAFVAPETTFVGHTLLPAAIERRGPLYLANMRRLLGVKADGTVMVPPTLTVAAGASLVLDLGGRPLAITGWPTSHTDCDLTVADGQTGTLIAGDLLFVQRLPVVDGSLNGWLATLDQLMAQPFARVVAGHGPPIAPWPAAAAPQRAYLVQLRDDLRRALAANVPIERAVEEAKLPDPGWLLADQDHPRNVLASFKELEWE